MDGRLAPHTHLTEQASVHRELFGVLAKLA